jgi:hypothetical protein
VRCWFSSTSCLNATAVYLQSIHYRLDFFFGTRMADDVVEGIDRIIRISDRRSGWAWERIPMLPVVIPFDLLAISDRNKYAKACFATKQSHAVASSVACRRCSPFIKTHANDSGTTCEYCWSNEHDCAFSTPDFRPITYVKLIRIYGGRFLMLPHTFFNVRGFQNRS